MKTLRTFKGLNKGSKCFICQTEDKGQVILVPIDGTAHERTEEALCMHVGCIKLRYNRNVGVVYQRVEGEENV
jgi:hypothetical protein